MRWILPILLMAAAGLEAQSEPFRYRGSLHAEASVGACVHGYAFGGGGGGGEVFLWKGLSAGVRASGNAFSDYGPIGIVLGEVGYHFVDRNRERGADPFLTFGVGAATTGTGFSRSGASGTFGGGVNYWFNRHVALRMEGRMIAIPGDGVFVFQFGAAFR